MHNMQFVHQRCLMMSLSSVELWDWFNSLLNSHPCRWNSIWLTDSGRNIHRLGKIIKFYSPYVKAHLLTSFLPLWRALHRMIQGFFCCCFVSFFNLKTFNSAFIKINLTVSFLAVWSRLEFKSLLEFTYTWGTILILNASILTLRWPAEINLTVNCISLTTYTSALAGRAKS